MNAPMFARNASVIGQNERARGACPTFFKACCLRAAMGLDGGYASAAYELTRHLDELAPYDLSDEAWEAQKTELEDLLSTADSDRRIVAWFKRNLPRCVELVPPRRRSRFIEGIRRWVDEYGL